MKTNFLFPRVLLALAAVALASCTTTAPKLSDHSATSVVGYSKGDGKSAKSNGDDLDEYDTVAIADPLEPVNRATFWLNHQLYTFIFRPISKSYEKVIPRVVRTGVYNAFDNVNFPVRFVNDALQGKFQRAGQETGRFVVNSVVGVGGLGRPADHIPALNVPAGETGQTFAKWGIGHGAYLVLPLLGPNSLRDTVGLAGDYALNPVSWISFIYGGYTWIIAISATDTLCGMPNKFFQYDASTKNSLDRYLAARSAYAQYRKEVASK